MGATGAMNVEKRSASAEDLGNRAASDGAMGITSFEAARAAFQGTSWVYRLNKDELIEELNRHGLPTNGNFEEVRKRLVSFVKHFSATPANSFNSLSTDVLCNQAMQDWGMKTGTIPKRRSQR